MSDIVPQNRKKYMKLFSGKINDLASFYRAFLNTRREMGISMLILLFITFTLSIVFYLVEHNEQPDVFDSWWSCIVWAYSRYIEGGDGVFEGGPITVTGRTIAFLLGIIGIAIVAIPAGIIGSGFMDAISEEKREKELDMFRDNLELAFRELVNVAFREYLQEHPDLCHLNNGKSGYYLPAYVPLAKLQLRYGMDTKDVFETTAKYPEFRITNLAQMESEEKNPDDRFVVTHQLINRPYGCFINRNSKITIVAPSSVLETLTGWFAHYLAMAGGFNLISKETEPKLGDFDSYAGITKKVTVNGYTFEELMKNKTKNADKLKLYKQKVENREAFLNDLKAVCTGEDSWLIYLNTAIMNSTNTDEFHFTMSKANGSDPMVLDANLAKYQKLVDDMTLMAKEDFDYSVVQSNRYPLPIGFSGYKLKEKAPETVFNALKINVGAPAIKDNRRMILIYKMAQCINEALGGTGMIEYDAKYLTSRHYGLRDYHPTV